MEDSNKIQKIKYGVPTVVVLARDFPLIRIQPIVDRKRKDINAAMKKFRDLDNHEVGDDCHSGNVGSYKGKPVVFDW